MKPFFGPDWDTHTETIRCTECDSIEQAEVLHIQPFWGYVHTCVNCGYVIMESEWEVVNSNPEMYGIGNETPLRQ